jgi:hypothetical protein
MGSPAASGQNQNVDRAEAPHRQLRGQASLQETTASAAKTKALLSKA